jgi:chromosome segregation ATPase
MTWSSTLHFFVLSVVMVTFCNCEMTGDPREGGIFWSENKANQRLAAKRAEMRQAQQETKSELAESSTLRARRSAVQSSLERQQGELRQMQGEIAALRQENTDEPEATKALEADVTHLEQRRAALSEDQSLSVAEMEHQLVELRDDVVRLKERKRLLMQSK